MVLSQVRELKGKVLAVQALLLQSTGQELRKELQRYKQQAYGQGYSRGDQAKRLLRLEGLRQIAVRCSGCCGVLTAVV